MSRLSFLAVLLALLIAGLTAPADARDRPDDPERWHGPEEWDEPDLDLPYSAGDLALDCNDDGMVEISRDLEVRWGSGTLTRDCTIIIADRVGVAFRLMTLSGQHDLDVQGGADVRLTMVEARIAMGGLINFETAGGGHLEISESELSTLPGGAINLSPGGDSSVTAITGSTIVSGGDLLIAASIFGGSGRTAVRGSTLSSGAGPLDGVVVYASLSGPEGEARVDDCSLSGTERIEVVTGDLGRTEVTHSTFHTVGPILIAAGEHGTCATQDNVPHADCSGA
jgi:hypothetical protein